MTETSVAPDELLLAFQKVRATAAWYDAGSGSVRIHLNTETEVSFKPCLAAGLEHAQPSDLLQIEISPSGMGLFFPSLDVDLYVPSILVGILQPTLLTDEAAHEAANFLPKPEDLYTYAVRWSAEDNEFLATCLEFPSLSWLALQPELALTCIRDLVRSTLEEMRTDGQHLLPPRG